MTRYIDIARIGEHLAGTRGLTELGVAAGCFALAWLVHRRYALRRGERGEVAAQGVFALVALVLLLIARAALARSGGTPLLDVAIPLGVALVVTRVLVYTLERLFPTASWLRGSSRAIAYAIWSALALYYLGVAGELVDFLDSIELPLGRQRVSLATIGQGALIVLATVAMTLWLSGFVERRVMSTGIDVNLRVVLAKFLRALLVVVGVLVSLPTIGVDLTLLSVFGGALGVGIGLGLQKLAANYIAGFTILLDRSVKLGDLVTADGRQGTITRFTSRYVLLRAFDGVEAIVPNETFVTTTVLNHASMGAKARIVVPVQVAYDADVERALALLEEAARAEPHVQLESNRAPRAYVTAFADSGVNLELMLWTSEPEGGLLALKSAVHRRILRTFGEAGIAIPYPQREVRVIGVPPGMAERPGTAARGSPLVE
ncbi:putative MscS family protein.1 [Burkholderiales bacterium]|nr:putative MscS family protein.1 [Burkholderiales bacterium]